LKLIIKFKTIELAEITFEKLTTECKFCLLLYIISVMHSYWRRSCYFTLVFHFIILKVVRHSDPAHHDMHLLN